MKAFDNISACDSEAQHHPDFILGWVRAATSVFSEVLRSLSILKIAEGFVFCVVCVKDNSPKSLTYQ